MPGEDWPSPQSMTAVKSPAVACGFEVWKVATAPAKAEPALALTATPGSIRTGSERKATLLATAVPITEPPLSRWLIVTWICSVSASVLLSSSL